MIVTSYPFLDASTEEYQEEEVYFQEEEDHFDQYTNQGKLIFLQVQSSNWARQHYFYFICNDPIPSFTLQVFNFGSPKFIFDSWFTWFSDGVVQEHHT